MFLAGREHIAKILKGRQSVALALFCLMLKRVKSATEIHIYSEKAIEEVKGFHVANEKNVELLQKSTSNKVTFVSDLFNVSFIATLQLEQAKKSLETAMHKTEDLEATIDGLNSRLTSSTLSLSDKESQLVVLQKEHSKRNHQWFLLAAGKAG